MNRRQFIAAGTAGIALAALSRHAAFAQAKTARIFVGFAAGGVGDLLARNAAEMMKPRWAPSVLVENRPGAAGRLALDAVHGAEPDGLSLLNTPASLLTIAPHAYKSPALSAFTDLVPVATMTDLDFGWVVGPMAPAKTFDEYLKLARDNPKLASYGTAGVGTPHHLTGFRIGKAAGVDLVHVPYRGGAPAFQDAATGNLPAFIGALSEPMIKGHRDGSLRVLATTGARRSPFLTDVPTLEEVGFKGAVITDWTCLLAPPRTPADIAEQTARIIIDVINDAAFANSIAKLNMLPLALGPAATAARLRTEYDQWAPLVREAGFTLDG